MAAPSVRLLDPSMQSVRHLSVCLLVAGLEACANQHSDGDVANADAGDADVTSSASTQRQTTPSSDSSSSDPSSSSLVSSSSTERQPTPSSDSSSSDPASSDLASSASTHRQTTHSSDRSSSGPGSSSLNSPGSTHHQTTHSSDQGSATSEPLDTTTVTPIDASTHLTEALTASDAGEPVDATLSHSANTNSAAESSTGAVAESTSNTTRPVSSHVSSSDAASNSAGASNLTFEVPSLETRDGGAADASVDATAHEVSSAIETSSLTDGAAASDTRAPDASVTMSDDSVVTGKYTAPADGGSPDASGASSASSIAATTGGTTVGSATIDAAIDAATTDSVVCGDGLVSGVESCDDGNTLDWDGCSATCNREPGYACSTPNIGATSGGDAVGQTAESGPSVCLLTVCGNGVSEGDEGCDDSNQIAGDGCGPTCQIEPSFTRTLVGDFYEPVAQLTCGDGLITTGEQCDDGNPFDNDGCSGSCEVEDGFSCVESVQYPDAVYMKVTYRDFKQRSNNAGGHPHMRVSGATPPNAGNDFGITGALCTAANQTTCSHLDVDGKPTYVGGSEGTHPTIDYTGDNLDEAYHKEAFRLWYRDVNLNSAGTGTVNDAVSQGDGNANTNAPIAIAPNPGPCTTGGGVCATAPSSQAMADTLALGKRTGLGDPDAAGAYQFSSNSNTFYPLGSAPTIPMRGFGYVTAGGSNRNWHFTTELRYFFQFQGGETLTFFGDDDLWVFVNGRLAVDIGGMHTTVYGRVVLGDENSSCTTPTSHATYSGTAPAACSRVDEELTDITDDRFQITKGGIYEIVVFHAERMPTGSNFQLSLAGFFAPRSFCTSVGEGSELGG